MTDIGMPTGLRAFGYADRDIDVLVDGTLKQTRQLAVVPRPTDRAALAGVFRSSY